VPDVSSTETPGWRSFAVGSLHGLLAGDEELLTDVTAAAEGGIDEVLDVLSRGGIRQMPDFVLVSTPENAPGQVVCRGTAHVVVTDGEGEHEVRAGARGPWTEVDLADEVTAVRLESGVAPEPAPVVPVSAPAAPATGGWKAPARFGRRSGTPAAVVPAEPAPEVPAEPVPEVPADPATAEPAPQTAPADPATADRAPAEPPSAEEPPSALAAPQPVSPPAPVPLVPDPPAQSMPPAPAAAAAPEATAPPPPTAPSLSTSPADDEDALPSYDHLFGVTAHAVPSQIERVEEPDEHDDAPPVIQARRPASPQPSELTMPPPVEEAEPVAPRPVQPPAPPPPSGGTLIASVPWATGGRTQPAPATPAPTPATSPVPSRPAPPPAAVTPATPVPLPPNQPVPAQPPPPPPPSPASAPVSTSPVIRNLPAPSVPTIPQPLPTPSEPPTQTGPPLEVTPIMPPPAPAYGSPAGAGAGADEAVEMTVDRRTLATAEPEGGAGPLVLSVLCPAGHASSPHSTKCRTCGRDIPPQQAFLSPRPPLGVLRLSTGDVVTLDRGVLFGRSPKINADLPAAERPHLVKLPSPDKDISRNHVEVFIDGWYVLVRDLGSVDGEVDSTAGTRIVERFSTCVQKEKSRRALRREVQLTRVPRPQLRDAIGRRSKQEEVGTARCNRVYGLVAAEASPQDDLVRVAVRVRGARPDVELRIPDERYLPIGNEALDHVRPRPRDSLANDAQRRLR